MATKKISALNTITTIADTDTLPIVDASATETKKTTALNLQDYILGDATTTDLTKLHEVTASKDELNYVDNVTSPIQTQFNNLGNVTKYIVATATTNGDFKINITNTLATNMKLLINFPAATNGASNGRISTDDGANYKDILDFAGANAVATNVQSSTRQLIYNGTAWVLDDLDYGSNANGNYTRYKDGTMICRNRKTVNTTINTVYSPFYITPFQGGQTFPKAFLGGTIPAVSFAVESTTNVFSLAATKATNTNTNGIYVASIASSATIDFDWGYVAIGKWK
jgi:hypothetical protein